MPAAATRPAGDVLPAAAHRAYRRTSRRLRRAARTAPGPARDAAYHQARKAAKRARYAGEAITPALGKPARRFTRQMKKVQTVLGEHQDAVVVRGLDRELGMSAHLAGENAFTYGLFFEREAQLAGEAGTPGPAAVAAPVPAALPPVVQLARRGPKPSGRTRGTGCGRFHAQAAGQAGRGRVAAATATAGAAGGSAADRRRASHARPGRG